jgi:transcription antitermination factor NusB
MKSHRRCARDVAFQILFASHFAGRPPAEITDRILDMIVRRDDDDRAVWKEILPEQKAIEETLREWLRRDGRYALELDEEVLGALYTVALGFPDLIDATTLAALRRALEDTGKAKRAPVMVVGGVRTSPRRLGAPVNAGEGEHAGAMKEERIRWVRDWVNMAMYGIAEQRKAELEEARLGARETIGLDRQLLASLLAAVTEQHQEIDDLFVASLRRWTLDRVQPTEAALIRLGIAEMLYTTGTDSVVIINECVDLAKRYGDEKAGGFVNAILDSVRKTAKPGPPTGGRRKAGARG